MTWLTGKRKQLHKHLRQSSYLINKSLNSCNSRAFACPQIKNKAKFSAPFSPKPDSVASSTGSGDPASSRAHWIVPRWIIPMANSTSADRTNPSLLEYTLTILPVLQRPRGPFFQSPRMKSPAAKFYAGVLYFFRPVIDCRNDPRHTSQKK